MRSTRSALGRWFLIGLLALLLGLMLPLIFLSNLIGGVGLAMAEPIKTKLNELIET